MSITEFKAFLDGIEVGLSGNPIRPDQWEALKAKLASVVVDGPALAPAAPADDLPVA